MADPKPEPSTTTTQAATLPAVARRWILAIEGGLVDDPKDPGGLTKFGISKASHSSVDIRNLTEDGAAAIYAADYWRPLRCAELPPGVALATFDAAVLHGVQRAGIMLQRALNELCHDDIVADGIVGPRTIHNARLAWATDHVETLAHLMAARVVFVADIARRNPTQERFLKGWARRFFLLQAVCLVIGGPNA